GDLGQVIGADGASGAVTAAPEALRLTGVVKRYGATTALDGVSLVARRGEFVALLGPNGAGKSTLIRILDGVEQPDAGTVSVETASHRLGVVHQDLGLVPTMTVAENLFLGTSRGWLRLTDELFEARRAL